MHRAEDIPLRLELVETKVAKHHKDLYEGNGQPALTVRMALMESCYEKLSKNLNRGVWLIVGTLLTAVVSLIINVLKSAR